MQQPDMRIDALDHLAVELQHQAQDAVRGRVLRPEINCEIAQFSFGHGLDSIRRRAASNKELRMVNGGA
jgi:hypothetical protein